MFRSRRKTLSAIVWPHSDLSRAQFKEGSTNLVQIVALLPDIWIRSFFASHYSENEVYISENTTWPISLVSCGFSASCLVPPSYRTIWNQRRWPATYKEIHIRFIHETANTFLTLLFTKICVETFIQESINFHKLSSGSGLSKTVI